MKTKSGEEYDNIYWTTFEVDYINVETKEVLSFRQKIVCPDSELMFYKVINKLEGAGRIDEATRLAAEHRMWRDGYAFVA